MLNASNICAFIKAFLAENTRRAKAAAGPTAKGISPTQLGRLAVNDPTIIFEILNGREVRRRGIERIATAAENVMPGFSEAYFAELDTHNDDGPIRQISSRKRVAR